MPPRCFSRRIAQDEINALPKEGMMPLAIAVLVPMIEVGATKLPFEELFACASKLLVEHGRV
jgi:hypothetical protein